VEESVAVFHEFVHCAQRQACEPALLAGIGLVHPEIGDPLTWEARHEFPYDDARFAAAYGRLLAVLPVGNLDAALDCHRDASSRVGPVDRAYMVWQEWREGTARWVENKVRRRLGLRRSNSGFSEPFGRETFHAGGAGIIEILVRTEPELLRRPADLYRSLRGNCAQEHRPVPERPPATAEAFCQAS